MTITTLSRISIKITTLLVLLTSCAAKFEQILPLASEFESNAEVITLEKPRWAFSGSAYNSELGIYASVNTKIWSAGSSVKKKDTRQKSNFLNYIVFDEDIYLTIEKYDISEKQRFSFQLHRNSEIISQSKCEIISRSIGSETVDKDKEPNHINKHILNKTRLQTDLLCEIQHNEKTWTLALSSRSEKEAKIHLRSENLSYDIRTILETSIVDSSGERPDIVNSKFTPSTPAGLEFFQGNIQLAAISFVGKSKIWLRNDLENKPKEVLLSANYSLIMFNWLDKHWRKTYFKEYE